MESNSCAKTWMIVAVTNCGASKGQGWDIGLFEGLLTCGCPTYELRKVKQYASAGFFPSNSEITGMMINEVGVNVGKLILDKPWTFVWGETKDELIDHFVKGEFELF